ncbi:MAG: hypothetical protein K0S38_1110, partial [Candidatus Paceibacter sp.]|nr:hypothetical protein [Candidatus Paceibacter sp.]
KCPICGDEYTELDRKIVYHVSYKPEVTTFACDGCNYAEHLIQHPEIETSYEMEKRKEVVRAWTLKNRPLIS